MHFILSTQHHHITIVIANKVKNINSQWLNKMKKKRINERKEKKRLKENENRKHNYKTSVFTAKKTKCYKHSQVNGK